MTAPSLSSSSSSTATAMGVRKRSRNIVRRRWPTSNLATMAVLTILTIALTSLYRSVLVTTTVPSPPSPLVPSSSSGKLRGDGSSDLSTLQEFLNDFQQSGRQSQQQQQQQLLLQNKQEQRRAKSDTGHEEAKTPPLPPVPQPSNKSGVTTVAPVPNPPFLPDGNTTFSACLLVMDDNPKLPEWLAYHYHVLPLRYLIVAVDPRSKKSPTAILNRWRTLPNDPMYIEEWDDARYLRPEMAANIVPDDAALQVKRDRHRMRQKNFYRKCLQRMRIQNRTWTLLIDTDEFLMYNHRGGDEESFQQWEERQQQRHNDSDKYPNNKSRIPLSRPPPSPAQPGAMIDYIRREQQAGHIFFQSPCISCPRLQFGAKESPQEDIERDVPLDGFPTDAARRLDTLRYRHHAERQAFVKNGLSKSLIDVSRLPPGQSIPRIETLHRPIKELCPPPWRDEWEAGLRVYHYLGSWEAYSYRDDSRRGGERSFEGWAFKARDADETDDNIRPWVSGFIEHHGPDQAKLLLQDAGLPPGYGGPSQNWTIIFLDEILNANETLGNDARRAFDGFVRDFHLIKNQSLDGIV